MKSGDDVPQGVHGELSQITSIVVHIIKNDTTGATITSINVHALGGVDGSGAGR